MSLDSREKIATMVSRLGRVKGELAYLNESPFHDYEGIRGELDDHIEVLDKVTEWLISEVKDIEEVKSVDSSSTTGDTE